MKATVVRERLAWAVLGLLAVPCASAQAQEADPAAAKPYFRCTDSEGTVQFSDRPCYGDRLLHANDPSLPQRKAQNDVRVREEQAAIARMEAERQAEEAAVRAAQERLNQSARQVEARIRAEKAARNAGVTSVLPSGGCDQCRNPDVSGPNTGWPSYIR